MPRPEQHVVDHGADRRYFHQMLNIADDELDPFEYRLLGHFRRVAGERSCVESVRETARRTRMSVGMVVATTRRLVAGGWLTVSVEGEPGLQQTLIEIVDRWRDNILRYAPKDRSPHEQVAQDRSPGEQVPSADRSLHEHPVHATNTPVHPMNASISAPVHGVNALKELQDVPEEPDVRSEKPRVRAVDQQSTDALTICPLCGKPRLMLENHLSRTCVPRAAAMRGVDVEAVWAELEVA